MSRTEAGRVTAAYEREDHGELVDAWMTRVTRGLPAPSLVTLFEDAFAKVWRRAHRTLGDVTLTAILDRVLCNVLDAHPVLDGLRADATGLHCDELHVGTLERDQVAGGVRFVLVEFLAVLGNLTDDILTPALHAELANHVVPPSAAAEEEPSGATAPRASADGNGS